MLFGMNHNLLCFLAVFKGSPTLGSSPGCKKSVGRVGAGGRGGLVGCRGDPECPRVSPGGRRKAIIWEEVLSVLQVEACLALALGVPCAESPMGAAWHWASAGFCSTMVCVIICKCSEVFLRKDLSQYRGLLNSSTYNKANIAEKIKGGRKMSSDRP